MTSPLPVLVLGATGYTGQLVAESLVAQGAPPILAGRNAQALAALVERTGAAGGRVIDLADPGSLDRALSGCGALLTCVGPFLALGDAAADACLRAGVHYVDTTAEQAFIDRLYDRCHEPARTAGATMMPGHAADFAFAYSAAGVLAARLGPLVRADSYHDLGDFRPSRGTARSMIGALSAPAFGWRDGARGPVADRWGPGSVLLPGEETPRSSAPFAGGDVALLTREMPSLRDCSSNLILSRAEARGVTMAVAAQPATRRLLSPGVVRWLQRRADAGLRDPTPDERAATPWILTTIAQGVDGRRAACQITGSSTYQDSAHVAALAALWLARGDARAPGVVTTGRAFDPAAFLDALAPLGIAWRLLETP